MLDSFGSKIINIVLPCQFIIEVEHKKFDVSKLFNNTVVYFY